MTDGNDSTAEDFCLPDLGEGMDAEIVSWLVGRGDRVVASQPLVTVETDKTVMDIPSPRSGVIAECLAAAGDVVEVGAPLLRFAAGAGRADTGAVVGELETPDAERASVVPQRGGRPSNAEEAPTAVRRVRASPKARHRARELGMDLATVTATGPEGVIQLRDVDTGGSKAERLIGVRRAMARRLADACARVARATVTGEADVSAWQGEEGVQGASTVRLVRAIAAAATSVPLLNAAYDDKREMLRRNPAVHLGVAMESADGLFAPVLRNVAGKPAETVAAELERLQQAVAERTIRREDLRGQTLSFSNFGAVCGLHAELVVVPPQVAAVGAGRVFERLVRRDRDTAAARILPLSVTFDHRVVTTLEACRFLNALIADLEQDA